MQHTREIQLGMEGEERISKYLRTDGYTIPDPKVEPARKRIKRGEKPIVSTSEPAKEYPAKVIANMKIMLDSTKDGNTLREVADTLILMATDQFRTRDEAAIALGISSRTLRSRLKAINTETHPTSS